MKTADAGLIQREKDLIQIVAKDPGLYQDTSLAALTVYSLFWLHQWQLRRTIEAVSVLNWRLFPDKFGMVGWSEYPDAFRTNRSLLQGQPKYRNWLTGAASTGFSLNERGIEIARDLIAKLGPPSTTTGKQAALRPSDAMVKQSASTRPRSVEPERELQLARNSRLFDKWQSQVLSERDLIHVHSLLRIFDHTPAKVRSKKMRDLERCAEDLQDAEMLQFLTDVRKQFPEVFANH
jgi:hypothetical protein